MDTRKSIFLSHIHEENDLAILIQKTIGDEFSGFVDVFVSSDSKSILAGTNFLKQIEGALLNASGAIFLISPRSVQRNWINFELGAVWIRGLGEAIIPAIPFCHSGLALENLPSPLNNLNAIQANDKSQLERAFYSIQKAVGARGELKTDFSTLSEQIKNIEHKNILCSRLARIISILVGNKFHKLLPQWEALEKGSIIEFKKSGIDASVFGELILLMKTCPKTNFDYDLIDIREVLDTSGDIHSSDIVVKIPVDLLISNKTELGKYKF